MTTQAFTEHQGADILRNLIVSAYVTFYQIKKFFVNFLFIIDNMSWRVGFGPRAVVWRPRSKTSQLTDSLTSSPPGDYYDFWCE